MGHAQQNSFVTEVLNYVSSYFYNESNFNGTGINITTTLPCNLSTPWEPLSLELQWFYCALFALIVPPAIVLNFMVICIILCVGKMREKATNYPILSLAFADLLTSLCNTPWNFYYNLHNDWNWITDIHWNQNFCKIDQFLSNAFIAASVFTLLVTSIDRYRVLCNPLGTTQSKGKMSMTMLGIWSVSLAISIPNWNYYLLYRAPEDNNRILCQWDERFRIGFLVYNIFFWMFTYLMVLLSMAYCYYNICNLLWDTRDIGERNEAQRKKKEDRKRMIIMLILVVISFAVGWLPTHIYFVVQEIWPCVKAQRSSQAIYMFFYWLAMLNSTLNPLIYYSFLPNFRRHFNRIFKRLFCLRTRRRRAVGINQLDRYDNSRTLAASRKNGLSNGTTMDTLVSVSQKHSLDAGADETVTDAQQICETDT